MYPQIFSVCIFCIILSNGLETLAIVRNSNSIEDIRSCLRFPENETSVKNVWRFDPKSGNLTVDLSRSIKVETCTDENDKQESLRVELISTTANIKDGCSSLNKDSFVQSWAMVNATSMIANFSFVQGLYFIKIAPCMVSKQGSCKASKEDEQKSICLGRKMDSQWIPFKFIPDFPDLRDEDACEFKSPSNISADVIYHDGESPENHCDVNIRALIPLCSTPTGSETVTLTLVDVGLGEVCTFGDFEMKQQRSVDDFSEQNYPISLITCERLPNSNLTDLHCENVSRAALLDHKVNHLARNSSYCMFFRLNNPKCKRQFDCMFYTETVSCGLLEEPRHRSFRIQAMFTEPAFICIVSLILITSLGILAWMVIKCSKKKPGTPLITQSQIGMMKKPTRSLTEDDLAHISRLPSQEIVLVYFPDTNRFKELNRKLRNWLITLDVNDVKDIYDEKATEEVLRNPEQWVKEALAGPEKRIILVCSRLAYDCLTSIKRGISSPRFVESDPHFGLLTRTIQYLDREMRGNYRNLICVRYEDLKICSRQYSSEAFNLVPGTEYVLPQHLEDVYRWIHPIRPNPECWSESRPEVRELLEAVRQYRHHDDNIFTVQFSATNVKCGD